MKSKKKPFEVVLNITPTGTKTAMLCMFKFNVLEYTVLYMDTG
jgi:hypothetical protein